MRSYLCAFRLRRKMELQYRGAMIGGIVCQVVFGLILIALYRALYSSKPQALPLEHVVTYVWLQQAFFRMLLASDPDLLDKIRTGGIAYDLCRPVSLYGFYYARIMAQKITGSVMRAVPMLLFAACLPEGWGICMPASVPVLLLALLALLLGLLCVSALENITMAFTMRTLDPRGVQAMLNLLMMTLSGNILPPLAEGDHAAAVRAAAGRADPPVHRGHAGGRRRGDPGDPGGVDRAPDRAGRAAVEPPPAENRTAGGLRK